VLALTALAVVLLALWLTVRLAAPRPTANSTSVEHAKKLSGQETEA
jgi:hypothetical protein